MPPPSLGNRHAVAGICGQRMSALGMAHAVPSSRMPIHSSTALLAEAPLEPENPLERFTEVFGRIRGHKERDLQSKTGGLIRFVRHFWPVLRATNAPGRKVGKYCGSQEARLRRLLIDRLSASWRTKFSAKWRTTAIFLAP